jgi:hypothetical protein
MIRKFNVARNVPLMIGVLLMIACAANTDPYYKTDESVYYGFDFYVGNDVHGIRNINYLYGQLGHHNIAFLSMPGSVTTDITTMCVPDVFEISWDNESGVHYEFKVPVRSKITKNIQDKELRFVVMNDHVEGYIVTTNHKVNKKTGLRYLSEDLERFY